MDEITQQAEPIVHKMLNTDDKDLYRELAIRRQVIADYPELKDQLDPQFDRAVGLGLKEDFQEVMQKFVDGVNRDAYALICTNDNKFKDLRAMFKSTPDKFTVALVGVLIGTGLVPAAIATVVAALIAKLILPNAQGALCEVWGERLPKKPA